MTISVFELFKVGIGPSSSHTVGPMRAAADFVADLDAMGVLVRVADVRVELYGSLAATGRGHGTLPAVLLGLEGYRPETIETEEMDAGRERLRNTGKIMLGGRVPIALSEDDIALYTRTVLDFHPNGMTLTAYGADDRTLHRQTYFSIGGGFVVTEGEAATEPVIADEDDNIVLVGRRTARARFRHRQVDQRGDARPRAAQAQSRGGSHEAASSA